MTEYRPIWEYFIFNGRNSLDFNCKITAGDYGSASRDIESVSVPGHSGDYTIDNKRFNNYEMTIPAYIPDNFRNSYAALTDHLMKSPGYCRYEDSFHPDFYRMARFSGPIDPDVYFTLAGRFDLNFDCMPQKWLKSGEIPITVTSDKPVTLHNPTNMTAKPLIKVVSGTGTIIVGSTAVSLAANNGNTIIDCELMDAYEGSQNRNSDLTLLSGSFPELPSGNTTIEVDPGVVIEITPRWWRI